MRSISLLARKAAPAHLLRGINVGILLNEHITADCPAVFAHACKLGAEGIVSKKIECDLPIRAACGLRR